MKFVRLCKRSGSIFLRVVEVCMFMGLSHVTNNKKKKTPQKQVL